MARQELKAKLPLTLFVGLGGTGCDIIRRISEMTNSDQRQFIRFVAFDTDANELRELRLAVSGLFSVQTSQRMTVGQALDTNPVAMNEWFPKNPQLYNKPLTEGAGQIRAISRLAFDSCVREGRISGLHQAIDELQRLNSDDIEQAMRVVIVTTLVGGTGSGILLPVSMYIRNYLETHCGKKPIIRGFCLLPDVFFKDPSKSEQEKEDLKANAYATLRELNAFIMRADAGKDSDLSRRYSFKLPREGTGTEFETLNEKPVDFCFLFDGQNFDGDGLANLTQYKDHAASCIYASSISILNKRLNSSEDNTILQRCAEEGRNCYCGIGSAKLIFPYHDVRDYVSYKWMERAMGDNWLKYDREIREENRKQEAKGGFKAVNDDRNKYIKKVESGAKNGNDFSAAILSECVIASSTDPSSKSEKWDEYIYALIAYAQEQAEDFKNSSAGFGAQSGAQIQKAIEGARETVQAFQFVDASTQLTKIDQEIKQYFNSAKKAAKENAKSLAVELFSPDYLDPEDTKKEHISYWLTVDKVPMHPNSIRYFLYQLYNSLDKASKELQTNGLKKDGEQILNTKEALSQDIDSPWGEDPFTKKIQLNGGRGYGSKRARRDEINNICDSYLDCLNSIFQYYTVALLEEILEEAKTFVDKVGKAYERFFEDLEALIRGFARQEHRIETAYETGINSPSAGSPTQYVCATRECLKSFVDACGGSINSFSLTDDFRRKLFDGYDKNIDDKTVKPCGIFNAVAVPDKERTTKLQNLVSIDVLDFWRNKLESDYGSRIKLDIIDALFKEAEVVGGAIEFADQMAYIERKKNEMFKLAAPFIDKPRGIEPRIIQAVGISKKVVEADSVDDAETLGKMRVLSEVFPEKDIDPFIDEFQLVCLKAVYNLKLTDLPKFAAASENPNNPSPDGSYCRAYKLRIDQILPNSEKTLRLTPHIDKNWHYLGVLPELDDKTEEKDLLEAHMAFFASFAEGWINLDSGGKYYFTKEDGGRMSDDIVVRDGRCNRLCEVFEAMRMSRPLTRDLLNRFRSEFEREQNGGGASGRDYTQSNVYQAMNKYLTSNICWPAGAKKLLREQDIEFKISIFELPILFKITMGDSTFKNETATKMMTNFIFIIRRYLAGFYGGSQAKLDEYYFAWIKEQAKLMMENLAKYYDFGKTDPRTIMREPFDDELVIDMVGMLQKKTVSLTQPDNAYAEATPEQIEFSDSIMKMFENNKKEFEKRRKEFEDLKKETETN